MFTGIVEAIGTIESVSEDGERSRLTLRASGLGGDFTLGESIAVDGVCLTVAGFEGDTWDVDVMKITRDTSTLGAAVVGSRVNVERAMRADARLGGHIVQGHVDGVATLVARSTEKDWDNLTFELPSALKRYVVLKGSIALNGTSLTVAELDDALVTVSLIPTTLAETTFGSMEVGHKANVEVDVIAKYVERMMGGHL